MGRNGGRTIPLPDKQFRTNQFIYWNETIYRIVPSQTPEERSRLYVVNDDTGETDVLELLKLLRPDEGCPPPLFAKNRQELEQKLAERKPAPEPIEAAGIRPSLVNKAAFIVNVVEYVEKELVNQRSDANRSAAASPTKEAIEEICKALPQKVHVVDSRVHFPQKIAVSTYYNYRGLYFEYRTKKRIAAALQRTTLGKTKMGRGLTHFVDIMIVRYYQRNPPISGAMLYELAEDVLR